MDLAFVMLLVVCGVCAIVYAGLARQNLDSDKPAPPAPSADGPDGGGEGD